MSDLQFTISREAFTEATNWVARSLSSNPRHPILAGIRIQARTEDEWGPQGLHLSVFDYEVAAQSTAPAEVATAGVVVVSGHLLQAIGKVLPKKPVEFSLNGSTVTVVCGAAEFTLPTMPADEYPGLPVSPEPQGSVDAALFAEAVAQVLPAVYRDKGNEVLKSVCANIGGDDVLTLTATDRHCVATRRIPWTSRAPGVQARMVLPPRTLSDAPGLGDGDEIDWSFPVPANVLSFSGGHRRMFTQLLAGEYPDIDRLFPTEYTAVATVKAADLAGPLSRVLVLDARDFPTVKLEFETDVVHVSGGTVVGGVREDVPVGYVGDPMTIWVHPRLLLQGLNATNAASVLIGLSAPLRPLTVVAYSAGYELGGPGPFPAFDDDFRYLLVPQRPQNTN
ncbi:DNA polymerase III subunit beta [Mycobacterium sp. MHSD3]|nr:DNA polymerase III subunit beta [Mycobacterium sp. MHSD3]